MGSRSKTSAVQGSARAPLYNIPAIPRTCQAVRAPRPPEHPVPDPVNCRKSRIPAGPIGIVVLVAIMMTVFIAGCILDEPPVSTDDGSVHTKDTTIPVTGNSLPPKLSQQDIQEQESVKSAAAEALTSGNWALFSFILTDKERLQYDPGNPVSSEEMKILADAIRRAERIDDERGYSWYETTVNGQKYTFMMRKEGGIWKIAGI